MIHDNVLSLIGQTPLVRLSRINPNPAVEILLKLESKSVGGSIKDRVALAMIEAAENSGELTPDKTVLEATSGNTGIGLAMVCAVKGYKLTLLMSELASEERKRILRAYGAEIVLTPGRLGTDGAIEEAYRLVRENPDNYVLMDQFNNFASILAHQQGTAREIWEQTHGQVTHVVSALGTSGTAMGLVKGLKALNPEVTVVAMEPFAGHKIQGLKNMQESYPPGIYDKFALDHIVRVNDEVAFETTRRLAREEGLLLGMSSGAAVAAALDFTRGLSFGLIVVICPDGGERYLSTPLFASKQEDGLRIRNAASGALAHVGGEGEQAGLFTPGPSLDEPDDLESWRRMVILDVLCRWLRKKGVQASAAVGLTDLDDRALATARIAHCGREEFVTLLIKELSQRAETLGIDKGVTFEPAGKHVDRTIALCRTLLRRGLAYEKLRSVYFDVLRDKSYGVLARTDFDGLSLGRTVDLENYIKDNPRDFTLLKRVSLQDLKNGDAIDTEWGKVRPSWFLQHAATALESLPKLTLVLAPEAYRFPHMENFRAIWTAAGVEPRAWMTSQPVNAPFSADEAKGRKPGFDTALALVGGGRALRFWLLSTSYHKPLSDSVQGLAMWGRNWRRLMDLTAVLNVAAVPRGQVSKEIYQVICDVKTSLATTIEDDFSLHRFWPVLFNFLKTINTRLANRDLSESERLDSLETLGRIDEILGLTDPSKLPLPRQSWPAEVTRLVEERAKARGAHDFARADALRGDLANLGYRLEDTPEGARLMPLG